MPRIKDRVRGALGLEPAKTPEESAPEPVVEQEAQPETPPTIINLPEQEPSPATTIPLRDAPVGIELAKQVYRVGLYVFALDAQANAAMGAGADVLTVQEDGLLTCKDDTLPFRNAVYFKEGRFLVAIPEVLAPRLTHRLSTPIQLPTGESYHLGDIEILFKI